MQSACWELLRRRFASARVAHAPYLLDAEVASAARGLLLARRLSAQRARQLVDDFAALRIIRHPSGPLLHRVLQLRDNLTAYDACYVALAEALKLPLLTLDAKIASAPTGAEVLVYPRA